MHPQSRTNAKCCPLLKNAQYANHPWKVDQILSTLVWDDLKSWETGKICEETAFSDLNKKTILRDMTNLSS